MVTHECSVAVRWSEADPAGIAFYPRFFEWFDVGTEALFAALGLPWRDVFSGYGIVGVPIVECGARFLSPVRYADAVRMRSTVTEVRDRTFRVEHEAWVGARRCAAGFEVRAWVPRPASPDAPLAAAPMPTEVARLLRGDL